MRRAYRKLKEPGVVFFDSGAFGLFAKHARHRKHDIHKWYRTKAFKRYVDSYGKFIQKFKDGMDYYANVDVLYHPELTYKVQRYLEKKYGLNPVPVVHSLTPLKWVKKYVDEGYNFIGLGGRGTGRGANEYRGWADKVFEYLCPRSNNYLPIVRVHGFALTSYDLLVRYPWWSVDSTSWVQGPSWGSIDVPHKRGGLFTFNEQPYNIMVSLDAPNLTGKGGMHFQKCSQEEQQIVLEWLDEIKVPLGSETRWGVVSEHNARKVANLRTWQRLAESLPDWPWPFRRTIIREPLL